MVLVIGKAWQGQVTKERVSHKTVTEVPAHRSEGPCDQRCPVLPSYSHEADLAGSAGAPESLTFRERQRLFSQGQDVSNKVKASRKLTELENELNTK